MNREDVIRMAREAASKTVDYDLAGRPITDADVLLMGAFGPLVIRIVDAAVAAEREACAKLAANTVCDTHIPTGVKIYGTRVAAAIRARSNT